MEPGLHLLFVFGHLSTRDLARIEIRREVLHGSRVQGQSFRVMGHAGEFRRWAGSLCSILYVQTWWARFSGGGEGGAGEDERDESRRRGLVQRGGLA